jgi:outer membrane biosynthesis protein TonB
VPVVGSRFWIEAGFIIAVAVVAGIERLSTWWIIAVVAAAWLIVAAVEIAVWARHVVARQQAAAMEQEEPEAAEAFPAREAVLVRPKPPVDVRPEPKAAPAPPRIVAVPAPPPEPVAQAEPKPEPEREPEPPRVVPFIPANDGPREWNLWELERASREHATDDVARNEERAYLLMYLREFAGPDGMLPSDFDGLVRDAFGDVLHSPA